MKADYGQEYPDRIDLETMAELCHTTTRNVRQWLYDGKLWQCDAIKAPGLGYKKGGPRWLLNKAEAEAYALAYNARE